MKWILFSMLVTAFAAQAATPTAKGDATAGKGIFTAKCVACHGKNAAGNAKMALMYKIDAVKLDLISEAAQKLTDEDAVKIVTDGKEKMKGFKGKLKDKEIADVVAYVKSLGAATTKK